jgi:hypothetical protein
MGYPGRASKKCFIQSSNENEFREDRSALSAAVWLRRSRLSLCWVNQSRRRLPMSRRYQFLKLQRKFAEDPFRRSREKIQHQAFSEGEEIRSGEFSSIPRLVCG